MGRIYLFIHLSNTLREILENGVSILVAHNVHPYFDDKIPLNSFFLLIMVTGEHKGSVIELGTNRYVRKIFMELNDSIHCYFCSEMLYVVHFKTLFQVSL